MAEKFVKSTFKKSYGQNEVLKDISLRLKRRVISIIRELW